MALVATLPSCATDTPFMHVTAVKLEATLFPTSRVSCAVHVTAGRAVNRRHGMIPLRICVAVGHPVKLALS